MGKLCRLVSDSARSLGFVHPGQTASPPQRLLRTSAAGMSSEHKI